MLDTASTDSALHSYKGHKAVRSLRLDIHGKATAEPARVSYIALEGRVTSLAQGTRRHPDRINRIMA